MGVALIKSLSWEEFANKVMLESNLSNKKFYNWIMSKKELGGTFFDSGTWRKAYEVHRQITYTDDDFVEIVAGLEGWGKSKLARQKAAIVDPTFCKERIFKDRQELYNWYQKNIHTTKGKAIIVDEGNLFFNSRETMTKKNVMFQKFLASCRAANTYIIICVPNFKTMDAYAREHRVEALTRLTQKHHAFKYYNMQGIKQIIKAIKKGIQIEHVRVKQSMHFKGFWNSQEPTINDLNESTYNQVKKDGFNLLLTECIGLEDKKREYMKPREVSEILGVASRTIRNHITDGKLKAKKIGSQWLIHKSDVQHLMPNINI